MLYFLQRECELLETESCEILMNKQALFQIGDSPSPLKLDNQVFPEMVWKSCRNFFYVTYLFQALNHRGFFCPLSKLWRCFKILRLPFKAIKTVEKILACSHFGLDFTSNIMHLFWWRESSLMRLILEWPSCTIGELATIGNKHQDTFIWSNSIRPSCESFLRGCGLV